MRISILLRGALVALIALFSVGLPSAHADTGSITLVVFKGGWIIGGSAGHGTLNLHGRRYPLSVGGIDYGLIFGGSRTVLQGRVRNIQRPSDVASTPPLAQVLPSLAAFARSCSPTRRAPFSSSPGGRSG